MGRAALLVFVILFFLFTEKVSGQNISNEGTDFWTVFPTHVAGRSGALNGTTIDNHAELSVFVTSKSNSEVTVSCRNYSQTKSIPANTAVEFNVTWAEAYISQFNTGLPDEANQVLTNRGIHIKVTDGKPKVSAYAHIYAGARSAASLILPYETLSQQYYSMNYTQSNGGNNFLAIVAVEDNTTVLLHEQNNTVKTITLAKAGDVYEYMSGRADLTGVYVETDQSTPCKKFAAFSGSSALPIVCTDSVDPLFQQLYPTISWGKNYGVVPFAKRRYILRILAQEDNTKVTYDGQTYTIGKGQFIESSQLTESTFINADKLVSVAQYSLTRACSSVTGDVIIGDPEMVILNPVEFNINSVTVFSSTLQTITERYINVIMLTSKASTFKVDGVAPSTPWTPVKGNTLYSYNQIPVTGTSANSTFKSLTLTAADGFNATAYGFGDFESYAYSAGTNLSSNNYLTVVDNSKNEESPNGCVGQVVDFKINLPYQPDKITWTLDNEPEVTTTTLTPETKTLNGQTIYVYRYPAQKKYTTSGEHSLNVVAHVPYNASNCQSGDLETNYVFTIYDLPVSGFTTSAAGCANSDISFTDQSNAIPSDIPITNWRWDFGDGTPFLDEQNPKHKYASDGNYNVTLSVKSGTGCWSDPAPFQTVNISPVPVSDFTVNNSITCISTDIKFTDNSKINTGIEPNAKIVKWLWDFGDNTTPSEEQNPVHQYSSSGTKSITLTTKSDKGCSSTSTIRTITITDLPIADFTTPTVCFEDGVVKFDNTSKNIDGTTSGLTYEWNFGDPQSPNNISTDVDGKHTFSAAGDYLILLKVKSSTGCEVTVSQPFTVNGKVEVADFSIQSESDLCSNKDVIINNLSVAASGKITKIEVYKDFERNPGETPIVINYPTNDDIHLVYTPFGGNLTRDYEIRLVAYSGQRCSDYVVKTITLKPSPILEFDDIPAVCQDDGSVVINQARETSGVDGTGIYSGDGVDVKGNFNPKSVNVGQRQHVITYTFTTTNGCTESISKTIDVYKSPTADAGPTIYILSGGQATIPAVAEGSGLTYKWTPSLGLDHYDVLNPVASPEKDTDYTLIATTDEGCTFTTSVTVKVLQALVPPNSFTPNGDGVNDVWTIKYLDTYPNATVEVFNRNGNRVFFSNGYKIPFDGNYQNLPLPVGVYYYLINPRNGRKTVTGPLTIIR